MTGRTHLARFLVGCAAASLVVLFLAAEGRAGKQYCVADDKVCTDPAFPNCCAGRCVNLKNGRDAVSDGAPDKNCGACGQGCPLATACMDGKCVDYERDAAHCGAPPNMVACRAGQACCLGRCVDPKLDAQNCSKCGVACDGPGAACKAGKCATAAACAPGQTRCGGDCARLKEDVAHCGACDKRCAEGQECRDGKCAEVKCAPVPARAMTACFGKCVDTKTDLANCHRCGHACPDGWSCVEGQCEL